MWPLVDQLETVRHLIVMDDGEGEVPDDPRVLDYEELISSASPVNFEVKDERQAASMCYTSGTTVSTMSFSTRTLTSTSTLTYSSGSSVTYTSRSPRRMR